MGKHRTSNIELPTSNDGGNAYVLNDDGGTSSRFNLEERLLRFASAIIDLSEALPTTRSANHVAGQILRCGTSAYPNHGEAESAESRDDFIYKMKICLKELRETRRWARLIRVKQWCRSDKDLLFVMSESDELIRIFVGSIQTAQRNQQMERRTKGAEKAAA
jgi:four helix bundle protein